MKIIINVNKVDLQYALWAVREVIIGGKPSKNKVGEQYCWATVFGSNESKKVVVSNNGRRKGSDTESFYVFKDERKDNNSNPI